MEDTLRGLQRERVFDTVIPRAVAIAEAQNAGKPITDYDASSQAAIATAQLGKEILKRITQFNQTRKAA